ncbi:hypothetical protein ACNPDB_001839 [Vibrio vulnificus]
MTKKTAINEYIFTLFIEKGLDGLTVPALRDELLTITGEFKDITEARKFLYRQLLPLEKKDYFGLRAKGGQEHTTNQSSSKKLYSNRKSVSNRS